MNLDHVVLKNQVTNGQVKFLFCLQYQYVQHAKNCMYWADTELLGML